jgi:hypothetical protein
VNRNLVIDALEARIREALEVKGLVTWGEEPKPHTGFTPEQQPAAWFVTGDEQNGGDATSRPTWTLGGTLYVFARGASRAEARTRANDLVDAVEASLKRQDGEVGQLHPWTTLGRVVFSARPTAVDGGEIGQQAVRWMDLEMVVPA